MSRFVPWDSEEGRRFKLSNRIHVLRAPRGAVAVHAIYAKHSFVVNAGSLSRSIKQAKEQLLEYMLQDPVGGPCGPMNATIRPITRKKAFALVGIDVEADAALIVATCLEVIRDCPDAETRLEAAQLLAQVSQFTGHREYH